MPSKNGLLRYARNDGFGLMQMFPSILKIAPMKKADASVGFSLKAYTARSASTHVQAAVDREVSTGGVAAFFRRQPGDDGGDFAGLAQAFDRHGSDDLG